MAWQSLTLRLVCGALPEAAAQLAYLAEIRRRDGDLADARRLAEQAAAICTELDITGPVRDSLDELLGMNRPPTGP